MRRDRAVRRRVRHARENKALVDLVVVEERLVRLVDAARDDLTGARGAGSGTARVREVDAGLLCGVEDVRVVLLLFGGGIEWEKGREMRKKKKKREKVEKPAAVPLQSQVAGVVARVVVVARRCWK